MIVIPVFLPFVTESYSCDAILRNMFLQWDWPFSMCFRWCHKYCVMLLRDVTVFVCWGDFINVCKDFVIKMSLNLWPHCVTFHHTNLTLIWADTSWPLKLINNTHDLEWCDETHLLCKRANLLSCIYYASLSVMHCIQMCGYSLSACSYYVFTCKHTVNHCLSCCRFSVLMPVSVT